MQKNSQKKKISGAI